MAETAPPKSGSLRQCGPAMLSPSPPLAPPQACLPARSSGGSSSKRWDLCFDSSADRKAAAAASSTRSSASLARRCSACEALRSTNNWQSSGSMGSKSRLAAEALSLGGEPVAAATSPGGEPGAA
eukprot:CAMPEP_0180475816 /NCGR_PEP_ID=MMETSP1036_2-20121128/31401_1 /TAXON_ID=632150 /ORGANISM="Azadinium spinosum, Strain 3D9" /LENGTH=124 /DNA_ID=CAMNT_0022483203 /DNA_START=363 /DNA_END=734 /DNA_ORIENTATION=-